MLDNVNASLFDIIGYVIFFVLIVINYFLALKDSEKSVENNYDQKRFKHYYTDDECINNCYFIGNEGGYGGHQCLMELDEFLEKEYRTILQEKGRIGLWNYGLEEGFFSNNSDDYYGFFGKDYSDKER